MRAKLSAYFACPYGFAESTQYFMDKVYLPELSKIVRVINPWELTSLEEIIKAKKEGREHEFAMEIGERNKNAIEESFFVIAALDGQEVDSGTAAEVAYAAAKGKRVYGYRSDFRKSGEQGVITNLQVEYFIEASGGKIATTFEELKQLVTAYVIEIS